MTFIQFGLADNVNLTKELHKMTVSKVEHRCMGTGVEQEKP